ncbi:hypothetical protein [Deinococcus hohokamensis]|uniref:Transposase n=1 Tax=Deinococcus hohokamensis TaxID=309883 RepID=A0ABV9I7M0_9DEIO
MRRTWVGDWEAFERLTALGAGPEPLLIDEQRRQLQEVMMIYGHLKAQIEEEHQAME